jgi:RNA polymerase sigma factor (TIGR02999 family)
MSPDSNSSPEAPANSETDDAANKRFWNNEVLPLLNQIAERHLLGEHHAITLEASDLVQEAYLRLANLSMPLNDRQHFLSMASTAMRRVLVDHARRKQAAKRGERPIRITLLSRQGQSQEVEAVQLLELDALLNNLAQADSRKAQVAEMHYFGGLTRSEMSEVTGLSPATLTRELRFVRSWIHAQLGSTG